MNDVSFKGRAFLIIRTFDKKLFIIREETIS